MNSEEEVVKTIRIVMAVTQETQKEIGVALGLSMNAINSKMNRRARWNLNELDLLAAHWKMRTVDLLEGPAHAVSSLPSAPRQRDRASAV
jgi:hypothetical protein